MTAFLLDTHSWAWSLYDSRRLSRTAVQAILGASIIWISPASIHEIAQKVRLNKWPEMAALVDDLIPSIERQKAEIARLDPPICLLAGMLVWSHRDPFDRMLAATALHYALPIISADTVFDGVVTRVW